MRSTTLKVTAASLAASAIIAGGLAAQMAAGRDPALGAKAQAPSAGKRAGERSALARPRSPSAGVPVPTPVPAPVVTRTS